MRIIKLDVDAQGLNRAAELAKRTTTGVKKASYNAIKRTASKMRVRVSTHVRKSYTAQASIVRKSLTTKTPKLNNLRGVILASGSPLPITAFKLSPNPRIAIERLKNGEKRQRQSRRPMRVQIRKGGASGSVPGLFIQQSSRSGYAGPMHRYLRSRYPLRIPYGPSVPQMVGNDDVLENFVPEAMEFYKKRFLHEVEVQLGRIK